jgi:flagellar basal body-associated protein FliL
MKGENVFWSICQSYLTQPAVCDPFDETKLKNTEAYTEGESNYMTYFIILIAVVFVCFLAIFLVYRRHLQNEMMKQIKFQVSDAVNARYTSMDSFRVNNKA